MQCGAVVRPWWEHPAEVLDGEAVVEQKQRHLAVGRAASTYSWKTRGTRRRDSRLRSAMLATPSSTGDLHRRRRPRHELRSDQLAHPVRNDRQRDLARVRRPAGELVRSIVSTAPPRPQIAV